MNGLKKVMVRWSDSYGVASGWQATDGYEAEELIIESLGFVLHENEKVVALVHNHAKATTNTPEQANGIMVIPKCCIKSITAFSCPGPESEPTPQHF